MSGRTITSLLIWIIAITSCNSLDHKNKRPSVSVRDLENCSESLIDKGSFSEVIDVTMGTDSMFWLAYDVLLSSGDYSVMIASGRGTSRKDELIIQPDNQNSVRISNPRIWVDPDGKLWIFWTKQVIYSSRIEDEIWALTGDPGSDDLIRSKPFFISDGILIGKPVLLSNGKLILPVGKDNQVLTIASIDHGKTWLHEGMVELEGDDFVRETDCFIIEYRNGSLWMVIQTSKGVYESKSTEQGLSWSKPITSGISSSGNPFFIHKLITGNILLVKQIEDKCSDLKAFISVDDAQTWSGGLTLDENIHLSHITGYQIKDLLFPCCAEINIIYCIQHDNKNDIHLLSFTEDDVLVGMKQHFSSPFR